jgi:competence ComEA-like helix-hairpin-helix protein
MRDYPRGGSGRLPEKQLRHRPIDPHDQATIARVAAVLLILAGASALGIHVSGEGMMRRDQATPLVASFRVNLNEADWPEIAALPGIGEKTARAIVAWRETHGHFSSADELEKIDGIGRMTAARLAGLVETPRDAMESSRVAMSRFAASNRFRR